jgi:hypothetical protein
MCSRGFQCIFTVSRFLVKKMLDHWFVVSRVHSPVVRSEA